VAYDDLATLKIRFDQGVAWVTLDNPPINLLDTQLITDLATVSRALAADPSVRVVVIDSANPEFFSAHADVSLIKDLPTDDVSLHLKPRGFQGMADRFRAMPKATIALIEGIARGGGSELALSCDMRFAALGKAVLAQPEVSLGIIPGGSGTQRLPGLVGRGRALEVVLGGGDIDAETAERWGYVNRALPDDEVRPFVETLALRIASFPPEAIMRAKAAVDAGLTDPLNGLLVEDQQFRMSLSDPETHQRLTDFLNAGGQTREFELRGFLR
jgi:enoyl-CoA hydratase/carnithine racemase